MGWVMTRRPVTFTRASGLEPTMSALAVVLVGRRKKYMYGLGLVARSAR